MTEQWPDELYDAMRRHPAGTQRPLDSTLSHETPSRRISSAETWVEDFSTPCSWCGSPATHQLEIHCIDSCNLPGLTPDGNVLNPVCKSCMKGTYQNVRGRLALAHWGHLRLYCWTCQCPLAELDDIIRDVVEL